MSWVKFEFQCVKYLDNSGHQTVIHVAQGNFCTHQPYRFPFRENMLRERPYYLFISVSRGCFFSLLAFLTSCLLIQEFRFFFFYHLIQQINKKNYLYFRNQSAIAHVLLTCLLEMAGDGITTNGASKHLSSFKCVTKNTFAKDDFYFTYLLSYLNTLFKTLM